LLLQVSEAKNHKRSRSWLYRFVIAGRERRMGLGAYPDVSLAQARRKRDECARLREQGIDPIEHRKAQLAAKALDRAKTKTFRECLEGWLKARADGWGSTKYAHDQRAQMMIYAVPMLGDLPIAAIDTGLVLRVLEPIWATKIVTARRVRDNLEAVLDYAKTHGYRGGDNPARWRGHLANVLPQPSKLHAVEHRAALPYAEIGNFMAALRELDTRNPPLRDYERRDAHALELIVLTASRLSEVTKMEWDEVNLANRIWVIPAPRMKSRREHRVPLSKGACTLLAEVEQRDRLVFPQARDKGMQKLRRAMGYGHVTTHGFRSSFRDWAAEQTGFPREVIETALAHVVGNETERAYVRGDLFEKRRRLMDAWAEFVSTAPATKRGDEKVVAIRKS